MRWTDKNVRDEGARMISEALKINTTLISLNLRGDWNKKRDKRRWKRKRLIRWTGIKIRTEGARMISGALKMNSTLTELNLSGERKKKRNE